MVGLNAEPVITAMRDVIQLIRLHAERVGKGNTMRERAFIVPFRLRILITP